MSPKARTTEKLKNVVLVVLFITAILLLYLLWRGDSASALRLSDLIPFSGEPAYVPACEDVIVPKSLIISDGSGSFAVKRDGLKDAFSKACELSKELCAGSANVDEITQEQFETARDSYPSALLYWDYPIPAQEFFEYFGIDAGTSLSGLGNIRCLGFSEAEISSLFIADPEAGTYYRLVASEEHPGFTEQLSSFAEGVEKVYYPAFAVLGGESGALIPLKMSSSLTECSFEPEGGSDPQKYYNSVAETIFGDTFDFVRRITDSFGNVTYMYGYGAKTFTVFAAGGIEYKAETEGSSRGFFGDLKTALEFAGKCGAFPEDKRLSYRLADYSVSGTGRLRVYEFRFAACVDGAVVYRESGYPFTVVVSRGAVSDYLGDGIVVSYGQTSGGAAAVDAVNTVANNSNHMYKVLNGDVLSENSDEAFNFVSGSLTGMSSGYYENKAARVLVPCWVVTTAQGTVFYFNLYDGTPLGYSE